MRLLMTVSSGKRWKMSGFFLLLFKVICMMLLCKPERFKLRIELVMIAQRVLAGADYEGK